VTVEGSKRVTLPAKAQLRAEATDDGLPNPPGKLTISWKKARGPGEVTFDDPGKLRTAASFSKPGSYSVLVTASDGERQGTADIRVTVEADPREGWRKSLADAEERIKRIHADFLGVGKKVKPIPAWLRRGRLIGFVIDARTGEVPAGVAFRAAGPGQKLSKFTLQRAGENRGMFEIQQLKPGKWRIEVRAPGYEAVIVEDLDVPVGNGPGMGVWRVFRLKRKDQ
jgi:hypothetical protein